MKMVVSHFILLCLWGADFAQAQGGPPPHWPDRQRMPMHEATPEQREQWREERRRHREARQQMSPEERQQLRRDIRDSGQALYPRDRRPPPD